MLAATLRARGAVYLGWLILTLAVVSHVHVLAQRACAQRDQGVVFGAMLVPPNATLEQLDPFRAEVTRIFKETPEFEAAFQITFPFQGFGGMLVKPWDQRSRQIFAIANDTNFKLARHSRRARPVFLPPALPSAGFLPGRVRDRLHG